MKLNLLFTVMNVLTILIYPLVFVHGKLRQFSKSIANVDSVNSSVVSSAAPGTQQIV